MQLEQTFFVWLISWIDPWYWVAVSVLFALIAYVGIDPIRASQEASTWELISVKFRQILLFVTFCVVFMVPLIPWLIAKWVLRPSGEVYADYLLGAIQYSGAKYWTGPIAIFILAKILSIAVNRYFVPNMSAFMKRWRVHQTGDVLSDIRAEKSRLKSINFLPSKFYKPDAFFMGKDHNDKPIYVPDSIWNKQNQKSIGPTQTGKGVHIGVQVDQAIRKGQCVFVIDPKPDAHLPHIMKQACEDTGRQFVSLDLNHGGVGKWAPFTGGSKRDIRSRIVYAFGLQDTGDQADFYKAAEREVLDKILVEWDCQLESLRKELMQPKYKNETGRMRSYVNEWLSIDTFSPRKGRGFSIERSMENNAVVYVRASLDDQTVLKSASVMIMEIVQLLKILHTEGRRNSHLFFVIDEVRFMISDMLADALATVVGFDCNLLIAYQSIRDLRSVKDQTVDAESIEESVNVNCKTTLCYMAVDTDTADWAAEMTGVIQKSVSQFEQVKIQRYGAEVWGNQRMLSKQEEHYIPANVFRMLPERVGVLFMPNELARILYTCWVPVKPEVMEEAQDKLELIAQQKAERSKEVELKALETDKQSGKSSASEKETASSAEDAPRRKAPEKQPLKQSDTAPTSDKSIADKEKAADETSKEVKAQPRSEGPRRSPASSKPAVPLEPMHPAAEKTVKLNSEARATLAALKEQLPSEKAAKPKLDNQPNPKSADQPAPNPVEQKRAEQRHQSEQKPSTPPHAANAPKSEKARSKKSDNAVNTDAKVSVTPDKPLAKKPKQKIKLNPDGTFKSQAPSVAPQRKAPVQEREGRQPKNASATKPLPATNKNAPAPVRADRNQDKRGVSPKVEAKKNEPKEQNKIKPADNKKAGPKPKQRVVLRPDGTLAPAPNSEKAAAKKPHDKSPARPKFNKKPTGKRPPNKSPVGRRPAAKKGPAPKTNKPSGDNS